MTQTKARIFVRCQGEGWHSWPEAPDSRSYLRNSHRHVFHIEAGCEVQHDDRAIEFHDAMDQVKLCWRKIAAKKSDLGSQSCEMLARRIGQHLVDWTAHSWIVSVSEDGEAGATVTTEPAA